MTSFAQVEFTDFEWVKHRPSWGEIPVARSNHIAFVYDKKMFIMGGQTTGAAPDGGVANNIPYLDLTSWVWGRQKLTGVAPSTGFLRQNCYFDEARNEVKVTLGPRWENSNQVIDVYKLDLTTMAWTKDSPRGRWPANWKMEVTVAMKSSGKLVQFGRHPLSNFSEQLVNGSQICPSSAAWVNFFELPRQEKEAIPLAAVPIPNTDSVCVYFYDPAKNVNKLTTFTGHPAHISATANIDHAGSEHLSTILVGDRLFLFESATLCLDKVPSVQMANSLTGTAPLHSHNIKFPARAPQRPRIGASVVHYDGYFIFFGGALSKEVDAKLCNDLHVLSVGLHQTIETVLDNLEVEDVARQLKDAEVEDEKPSGGVDDVIELSDKKKHKKKVEFAEEAAPSASEDTPKKQELPDPDLTATTSAPPPPPVPTADGMKRRLVVTVEVSPLPAASSSTDSPLHKPIPPPAPPTKGVLVEPSDKEAGVPFLEANQGNLSRLLAFAVNNPNCYPDMAFKVGGQLFWAHKAIICARSSRWRAHLDPKSKTSGSPSSGRRGSTDLEDSQLDVSTESAVPKDKPSPFMFGKLGATAMELLLDEEEDNKPKFEMVPLPGAKVATLVATPSSSAHPLDTITPSPSNSGIAPPATSVPAYTIDHLTANAFEKVLNFMYTGQITVSQNEAEDIADVAHEFLLDRVSALCRDGTNRTESEPQVKTARLLRRLVGTNVGSDFFFVVRHKKLFAHRFIILLFSQHFRQLMLSRPDKSYLEVKEIEQLAMPVETFIDFCRMMYCNFSSLPEHAEKKMDVANLQRLASDWKEFRCLSLIRSTKPDAKSTLDLYRLATSNPILLRDVRKSVIVNFSRFAQEKAVIKELTSKEQKAWLELGDLNGASWLDKLWFANSCGNTKLAATAEAALADLINVENVLPVLYGAHQTGSKELRSLCMDFMTAHSTSIEDAQRMEVDAPLSLGKVSSLSASVNNELTNKLTNVTTGAKGSEQKMKNCAFCLKSFSTFGKKNTCCMCHKIACSDCTRKKVVIPQIFGVSKPRDVCLYCAQVVEIWKEPVKK